MWDLKCLSDQQKAALETSYRPVVGFQGAGVYESFLDGPVWVCLKSWMAEVVIKVQTET